MKKIFPLIFILIGLALTITAIVFWIDTNTGNKSPNFGQSLRDWLTLITGFGTSIKGWIDLFKKDKPLSNTQIFIQGSNAQITSDEVTMKNIQTKMIDNRTVSKEKIIKNDSLQIIDLDQIKPILRNFITDSLSEQELREIITDYFTEVELSISSKNSKREVVGELVNYCLRQDKVKYLIEIICKYNPYQYSKYRKQLEIFTLNLKSNE